MPKSGLSRREFLRVGAGTAVASSVGGTSTLIPQETLQASPRVAAASDRVRFGSIGTGVRGCTLIRTALASPGTEIVAACDLYDGRLTAAKEYANKDLFTTKDYRAILDRPDIDAVFVATPDHWHARIVEDACAAGKDVYCEKTIDWRQFLGNAPMRPFDAKRFFRWRCFRDYGEGLPGDIYVHLLTGIHFIAGITAPPLRAESMGGLFWWKEDRDVPDLMWTLYDYRDFRVSIRSNLNNESVDVTRIFGTQGTLEIKGNLLTFTPQDTRPRPEPYSILGWPQKLREEYLRQWHAEHPEPAPGQYSVEREAESFSAPNGYDDSRDHISNFIQSMRTRQTPVEDAVFGNNVALACHMANYSETKRAIATWDAATERIME